MASGSQFGETERGKREREGRLDKGNIVIWHERSTLEGGGGLPCQQKWQMGYFVCSLAANM